MNGTEQHSPNDVPPPSRQPGRRLRPRFVRRLAADESGGEVIEYVLIAGLIAVAAIAAITGFGVKVLARWTSVSDSSL